ncbi:MAG: L-threonylcarbamoyladenylate synthase [Bacteroidales bacterium]
MEEDIKKAIEVLKAGGTIIYPSDTIWGIGCDATNFKAAQKIYNIKSRKGKSNFIVLVDRIEKISEYVSKLPDITMDLLDSIDFPTTVIYPGAKNLAKNVMAADGSIAIRVVKSGFSHELINKFGKAIVSTSANFSGEPAPVMFKDISKDMLKMVGYVTETGRTTLKEAKASTIIRLKPNGEFEIIRE